MSYPGQYPQSTYPPQQNYQQYPPAQQYPPPAGQQPYPPPPAGGQPSLDKPQQYPPPADYRGQQTPQQYPPPSGHPPQQYPPPAGAYPPPAGAYPPPAAYGAYPPPGGAYPPPAAYGAYPPPGGAYPPPVAAAYPYRGPAAYPPPPTAAYPSGAYGAPTAYPAAYAAPVTYGIPATPVVPVAIGVQNYSFQFRGSRLDRKDLFSKSDPFLILMASKHPGGWATAHAAKRERKSTKHNKKFGVHSANWVMIHRTETIHNNQNPTWNPFIVNIIALCGGNFDTQFKIEVWDSDHHSNHDFIGSAVVTLRDLQVTREVRLTNKRRIGIYNSSGMVEVLVLQPA